jgi:hypothetical protein
MKTHDTPGGTFNIHINSSGFVDSPGSSKAKYKVNLSRDVQFKLDAGVRSGTVDFGANSPFSVSSISLPQASALPAINKGKGFTMTLKDLQSTTGEPLTGMTGTLDVDSKTEDE